MQREWGGGVLLIIVILLGWIYRTSINGRRVLLQMQTLARELAKNSAALDTKRAAIAESDAAAAARRRRMDEMALETDMLRSEVGRLKERCATLEAYRETHEKVEGDLRAKLDEALKSRTRLQKQLDDAQARELEVRARHGGDVVALNRLRTRNKTVPFLPRSTDDSQSPSSELQDVAPPPPPPRRLPKTPSETYLLSLQPNLSATDDDSDVIATEHSVSDAVARVSPTLARPSPPSRSGSTRTPRQRRRRSGARSTDGAVSLSRAPWADTLPPLRHFSIANNEFDGVVARTVASNTHTSASE